MLDVFSASPLMTILVLAWVLPWKGYSLWKSARNGHKWWFIALLIVNTFALLEALYIFYFSKKMKGGAEKSDVGGRNEKTFHIFHLNKKGKQKLSEGKK